MTGAPNSRPDRDLSGLRAVPRRSAVFLIHSYRVLISPLLGANCRFAPSCSHYAEEAVRRHGLARGGGMALRRLLRCHPWNPGGWDPVA